ncbi:MAG: hypothetical protein LBU88_10270 [Treponema sp.]|jgi:outer membrane protein assembly factor BamB|nr:hypothetical protein [Treponema sp.]
MKNKIFYLTVIFLFIVTGLVSAQARQSRQSSNRVDISASKVGAAPLWDVSIGDTVRGSPHLQASSAVLVGERGSVRSFFMSSTPLWNFDARGTSTSFIARSYEAATYVCNTEGIFMAINRVGRELWRLNLGKPITQPTVVGWDGRVFITVDSTITCRTASGNPLWTLDLGSNVVFPPILDRTGSYAAVLQNNDFIKLGQFSHLEKIRLDRVPSMIVSLAEENRQSYVLIYPAGEMEKVIYNNSAREGARLSKQSLSRLPAAPAASVSRDSQFAVTLRDGRVLLLNASGNVLWTRNSHEHTSERGSGNISMEQAGMMWDERGIYTNTIRGVSAFSPEGRRRFVHKLSNQSSGVPALSDEGLLYATGTDNILRVYNIEMKPRTIPITRFYGPEPEGSYGMGNPPPSPWTGDDNRYDEISQDRVYEEISAVILSGQLGKNEPVYVAYIMEMCSWFFNQPHASQVRPLVRPEQRVRLVELLAHVGSRETVPYLWNLFDRDQEPAVRRACADAIGKIGVDPTGRSFYSYQYLLAPGNPNIDPQLVLAASSSIANLCRFSGPPLAPEGIRVLRYFSNLPTLPNAVKVQIRNEMNGLFREGLDRVIQ